MNSNSAEREARKDLAAAHRLAVLHGLNEGVWNHISLLSPDDPSQMLISPGHTHWSQVRASNLALVDEHGNEDFQSMMKQIRRKDHTVENGLFPIFDMIDLPDFQAGVSEAGFLPRLGR